MSHSQIVRPLFKSRSLLNNALGDPAEREVQVYLPPGYEDEKNRYPVTFLLAGYVGTGLSFMNYAPWEDNIQQRLDRLISSGSCAPMIVVMPDCFTRYGGSQYLDSPSTGKYRSYLLELVRFIDQQFRTLPDRDHRAIIGKSSGGYGALVTAMDHSDTFGLVVDHSGDKYFEKCYARELLELPNLIAKYDIHAVLADPYNFYPKGSAFFQLMSMAAMAACYSPSETSELGFDWPVDPYTGELRPEVWQRWTHHDPVHKLHDRQAALSSMKLLFFDCGNRDEYSIHLGCRLLDKRLDELEIPHLYEEFDGGHRHTLFRYDRSFPLISENFPS